MMYNNMQVLFSEPGIVLLEVLEEQTRHSRAAHAADDDMGYGIGDTGHGRLRILGGLKAYGKLFWEIKKKFSKCLTFFHTASIILG